MEKNAFSIVTLFLLTTLILGCISDYTSTTTTSTMPEPTTTLPGDVHQAKLTTSSTPELGDFLVDGKGMTLYMFKNDEPGLSNCYGQCEANWHPFIAEGDIAVSEGIMEKLDVTRRTDGRIQVTYNGMLLYHFIEDENPGDIKGQGRNGVWYAVSADGMPVGDAGSATTTLAPSTTLGESSTTILPSTTLASTPTGMFIAKTSEVTSGSSKDFTYNGKKAILVNFNGDYKAYVNSCTHEGCPTSFSNDALTCPCHGSVFDPATGEATTGPASTPLESITVVVEADDIYGL